MLHKQQCPWALIRARPTARHRMDLQYLLVLSACVVDAVSTEKSVVTLCVPNTRMSANQNFLVCVQVDSFSEVRWHDLEQCSGLDANSVPQPRL